MLNCYASLHWFIVANSDMFFVIFWRLAVNGETFIIIVMEDQDIDADDFQKFTETWKNSTHKYGRIWRHIIEKVRDLPYLVMTGNPATNSGVTCKLVCCVVSVDWLSEQRLLHYTTGEHGWGTEGSLKLKGSGKTIPWCVFLQNVAH